MRLLTFIETSYFSKKIKELLDDESYHQLQVELYTDPEKGKVIKQGGGIRKVRWAAAQSGKSGGIRVIYYYLDTEGCIYMLLAYGKSEQDNLTKEQLATLHKLVKQELKNG